MRRRRRPTLGGTGRVSWRWEVGAPLVVIGLVVAGMTIGLDGAEVLFWAGALVAGVGLAFFLERS